MRKQFFLIFAALFIGACSAENRQAGESLVADVLPAKLTVEESTQDHDAELVYQNLETEFLERINGTRDSDQRRLLAEQYSKWFREMAIHSPDSTAADKAWSMVLVFGTGQLKVEAMDSRLAAAQADSDSVRAVGLLSRVVDHGVDPQKSVALQQLTQIALIDPATEVSIQGLAALGASNATETEIRQSAINRLLERHCDHSVMLDVAIRLGETQNADNERWLKAVCGKTAGEAHATAVVTLARFIKRRDEVRDYYLGQPAPGADAKRQQNALSRCSAEFVAWLNAEQAPGEKEQLEKWLVAIVADNKVAGSAVLGDAKRELFAIQHLTIGSPAPEIVGADIDGVTFKLSDYRGKVVLLTFWADS